MPGVPSSRGCDGCRKQKQKCHTVNAAPPCSRCNRLGIACVGLGKQRFKFLDEGKQLARRNGRPATTITSDSINSNELSVVAIPSYGLANRFTRLISAFVSNIDPSADIKIQLPWNFGGFLSDIPCRLGTNEALDAASEALVTSYTRFIAGDVVASPDVLMKHANALGALRRCLDDPVMAYSSETLCSTMVLIIVQTLPGLNPTYARGHSVGAAQILKGRGFTGPKDDFESKLLLSLRGPVAVEGLINDQISMTQQQWKDLVYNQIDIDNIDGQMMKCLARLPDLMHRGRCTLRSSSLPTTHLLEVQKEVRALRDSFGPTLESLRQRWNDTDITIATQFPEFIHSRSIIHAHFSRSYGMALAVGIILNCMLAALDGNAHEVSQASAQLSDEVLDLADAVDQYRPLGTIYMVLCLAAAWVGATNPEKKIIIEIRLVDYKTDVLGPVATHYPAGLELIETRFSLK